VPLPRISLHAVNRRRRLQRLLFRRISPLVPNSRSAPSPPGDCEVFLMRRWRSSFLARTDLSCNNLFRALYQKGAPRLSSRMEMTKPGRFTFCQLSYQCLKEEGGKITPCLARKVKYCFSVCFASICFA